MPSQSSTFILMISKNSSLISASERVLDLISSPFTVSLFRMSLTSKIFLWCCSSFRISAKFRILQGVLSELPPPLAGVIGLDKDVREGKVLWGGLVPGGGLPVSAMVGGH